MVERSEEARRVIESISLTALVGATTALADDTGQKRGPCPWHTDPRPSLYVKDDPGFFYCFACGVGGDALSWVMRRDELAETSALQVLASWRDASR